MLFMAFYQMLMPATGANKNVKNEGKGLTAYRLSHVLFARNTGKHN